MEYGSTWIGFARWVSLLLVCLPLAQPAITKGALSRKIDQLNEQARRHLVWDKDRSGQLALLETSFVRPGQNQRDNEKDCANSSTESDKVRMEKSACMRAAQTNFVSSGVVWSGYKWRRRDNVSTDCTGANVLLKI